LSTLRNSIKATADEAVQLQKSVALIQTIDQSGRSAGSLTGSIRSISDQFNIPQLQVAEGLYQTISNQIGNATQSIEFMTTAAKFARATNSSLADSVDLISGGLKAFNLDISEADWDFIHDVNLKAAFFCCQEGARQMKKKGAGRIVNISSLGGIRPWAEHAHYCASKAGLIMLTKALAKAFAPEITVNSVAPGVIAFNDIDARTQAMIDATPMRRAGKAEEIAAAVHFFLTAPEFITGQILAVDGGLADR